MSYLFAEGQCCLRYHQCIYKRRSSCFRTSSTLRAKIPPESPKFIEIPRPVQPKQPFPIHMKGVLPVPRPIFPRSSTADNHKATPEYLASVTPEPIEDKPPGVNNEFINWKARQAESRRRNLRESLIELHQRKQDTDRFTNTRFALRRAIRHQLLHAPEPEDRRLTNPSVLQSSQPKKHQPLLDPQREARLQRKRENVASMEAMRQENRRNSLHTLYVNAGDFITTGAHLEKVIDKVFDDNSIFSNDSKKGLNIWNLGLPETVQELLAKANKSGKQTALESAEGHAGVTRKRMKRIAEELTGGKMEDAR